MPASFLQDCWRRGHTTLGNPFVGRMNDPVDFHARFKQVMDETEKLIVHHFFPEAPQDRLVGDFVKASLDIPLDDPGVSRQRRLATTGHRVVRTPVGPKPIGVLMEFDLENGFQRHAYCLLDDFVPQTGDSKLAHFAVSLGNLHPP